MIEYFTKRRSPNGTEYHFTLDHGNVSPYVITVVRVTRWYKFNETILYREMFNPVDALNFFQSLLDTFPRDQLYKE